MFIRMYAPKLCDCCPIVIAFGVVLRVGRKQSHSGVFLGCRHQ
nr:MAG TPA: hypothetical protein [Caudoviricetes sp.]